MTTMDDFFKGAAPAWEAHPMLRHWREMKDRSDIGGVKFELYRPRDGLTFRPAQIYVTFTRKDGVPLSPEKEDWDDVLNEGLLKLHVPAASKENESERFALGLRAALEPIDGRFGEGHFNAVLLKVIQSSPFARNPAVARVLAEIDRGASVLDGASSDCSEMILNALRGRAQELVGDLGYPEADAQEILASAIAKYLDERFSVTNRKLLGW